MSQSEIARFMADMKSNRDLRSDVETLHTDKAIPLEAVMSLVKRKGYGFTAPELLASVTMAKAGASDKHLTDAELDRVAGGQHGDGMRSDWSYSDWSYSVDLIQAWQGSSDTGSIFVRFDEDSDNLSIGAGNQGNHVYFTVIANEAAFGLLEGTSTVGGYDHHSLLRKFEDALNESGETSATPEPKSQDPR